MTQLFDRLPDRLFSPLASANRRIYGTLLLDLYPLFFDQIHADVFPSRDTVRQEIEERLAVMAAAWQEEPDAAPVQAPVPVPATEPETNPASQAYRRLLMAGWIEEETEGYRVRVTVPPAVGTLWASLMEVARPDRVFYGGMVLSIFNNVQRAWEEPQAQVLALRQAAREARRFIQHLNTMIYGLKGLLGEISGCDDHRRILSRFFDDFVERILVQDYKRLKTRNNPFRYRQQILQRVRELEYDVERKEALVAGYLEQTEESDSESAWQSINADIRQLRDCFERLDGHLERVDRFRARVERRVADTVRYLDRTQPGMAARIAGLLRELGPRLAGLADGESTPLPLPLIDALPVGPQSLREAPRHRRPPDPRPLVSRPLDPAVQARQQALRAYLDRRRIDPKRIALYLERQLGGRSRIDGAAMTIGSVEDFIAFTHVRHLGYLPGAGRLRQAYRIEQREGIIDNDWVRCPDFAVMRRQLSARPAALGDQGAA
jgi:Wadjet protein JetA